MKHRASRRFWACYNALLIELQRLADRCCELLRQNPHHPSLMRDKNSSAHVELWAHMSISGPKRIASNFRRDKAYSRCDAISFTFMRRKGTSEALTTDRHFEQEGFRRLLA